MRGLLLFLLGLVGGFIVGEWYGHEYVTLTDTVYDTVTRYDTVRVREAVPYDSVVIDYKVKRIAVNDTTHVVRYTDSVVEVMLPVTQKHYVSERYEAWVSGYEPNLDSINIYTKESTITGIARTKAPRWHVGVSTGAAVTPKGAQPYIGIGVTYTLFDIK